MYGDKPYDKSIMPVENIYVSIAAMGEGFHNYHVRSNLFQTLSTFADKTFVLSMFFRSTIEQENMADFGRIISIILQLPLSIFAPTSVWPTTGNQPLQR